MRRGYAEAVASGEVILTDGAINTRLEHNTPVPLHPVVKAASCLLTPADSRVLRAMYTSYVALAAEFDLPIVLTTPTSRTDAGRLREAGLPVGGPDDLNVRAVALLREIRDAHPEVEIFVAGAIGAANDAYRPEEGLDTAAARSHHAEQARRLADAGCDVITVAPFPSVAEATGAAQAAADTGVPVTVAFVLDGDGDVLDGTSLADAIRHLDAAVDPVPVHYFVQCVHPRVALLGLQRLGEEDRSLLQRLRGFKANSADLDVAALERSTDLEGDEPEPWAGAITQLHDRFGTNVLGGCCGTDERHLFSLALRLGAPVA